MMRKIIKIIIVLLFMGIISTQICCISYGKTYITSIWDFEEVFEGIFIAIVVIFWVLYRIINGKSVYDADEYIEPLHKNYKRGDYKNRKHSRALEKQIRRTNKVFDNEEFIVWAEEIFIKVLEAWTARDCDLLRPIETKELFLKQQSDLQSFIDDHQINIIDRIFIENAYFSEFVQSGENETMTVTLNAKMVNYIVSEETNDIIDGNKDVQVSNTYKMIFCKKVGANTNVGSVKNCPCCGAPTSTSSLEKCEFCGSLITAKNQDWVLASLEKLY